MGCVISVLISTTSPFLAEPGTRRRGLMSSAISSSSAAAAANGDLDLAARRIERAVAHLGHRDDLLRLLQAHPQRDLGLAGERRQLEHRDAGIGVAVGGDVD